MVIIYSWPDLHGILLALPIISPICIVYNDLSETYHDGLCVFVCVDAYLRAMFDEQSDNHTIEINAGAFYQVNTLNRT